jgi:hypothetical protein
LRLTGIPVEVPSGSRSACENRPGSGSRQRRTKSGSQPCRLLAARRLRSAANSSHFQHVECVTGCPYELGRTCVDADARTRQLGRMFVAARRSTKCESPQSNAASRRWITTASRCDEGLAGGGPH